MNGTFSPLDKFMDEKTFDSVVENWHLPDGRLMPMPVVLDTDREDVAVGQNVLLKYRGQDVAMLNVESVFTPDKPKECLNLFGTASIEHPGVRYVAMERGNKYVSGSIQGIEMPKRDYPCPTPAQVRAKLPEDAESVLVFQIRNPIHLAHYNVMMRSFQDESVGKNAVMLVHPTVGPTQEDDIPGSVRVHTYEHLEKELSDDRLIWANFPYSMYLGGDREAVFHAFMRRNFGATHFCVGRDMAGSKSSVTGEDFYGPYAAQERLAEYADELGITPVKSLNLVYIDGEGYLTAEEAKERGLSPKKLSGTEFRRMLRAGEDIPDWFAFPSVVEVLRRESK